MCNPKCNLSRKQCDFGGANRSDDYQQPWIRVYDGTTDQILSEYKYHTLEEILSLVRGSVRNDGMTRKVLAFDGYCEYINSGE